MNSGLQICGTIKFRLNNKSAKVRQQAADLISRIAVVMMRCGEEQLMGHLGVVLYEYLGEEYPEVLGSILGALKVCCLLAKHTKHVHLCIYACVRISWHSRRDMKDACEIWCAFFCKLGLVLSSERRESLCRQLDCTSGCI